MDGGRSCLIYCIMVGCLLCALKIAFAWCMHVYFILFEKSCFVGVNGFSGACVSRAQAGMGYYLGGAPLVTREWIILSDVP